MLTGGRGEDTLDGSDGFDTADFELSEQAVTVDLDAGTGQGGEALGDLSRLAAASAQDEGDQDDEDALIEIEEFVRVAALLLHGDCAMGARHRRQLH